MASLFLSPFHGSRAVVLPRPCHQSRSLSAQACSGLCLSAMATKGSSFCLTQKVLLSWHNMGEPQDRRKHYREQLHPRLLSSAPSSSSTRCSRASSLRTFVPPYKGLTYLHSFVNFGGVKTAEFYSYSYLVNMTAIVLLSASLMERNMPLLSILV